MPSRNTTISNGRFPVISRTQKPRRDNPRNDVPRGGEQTKAKTNSWFQARHQQAQAERRDPTVSLPFVVERKEKINNLEIIKRQQPQPMKLCRTCWILSPVPLCKGIHPFCIPPRPICRDCQVEQPGSRCKFECTICQKDNALLKQQFVDALSEVGLTGRNIIEMVFVYQPIVRYYKCISPLPSVKCVGVITICNDAYKHAIDSKGESCFYSFDDDAYGTNLKISCSSCGQGRGRRTDPKYTNFAAINRMSRTTDLRHSERTSRF